MEAPPVAAPQSPAGASPTESGGRPDPAAPDISAPPTPTSGPVGTPAHVRRRPPRRRVDAVLAAAIAVLGLVVGLVVGFPIGIGDRHAESTLRPAPAALPPSATWADVYAATHASVVKVNTTTGSVGSGFVIGRGTVATSAHVLTGASPYSAAQVSAAIKGTTVQVTSGDGVSTTGTVQGVDPRRDIALISVPDIFTDTRPALPWAATSHHPAGAPAAVVGFPFGGDQIISTGVVSGYLTNSRFATSDAQTVFVQTDAAVNPGNSGGPLLSDRGEVLGMIALRPEDVDGRPSESVALALPATLLRAVTRELAHDNLPLVPVAGFIAEPAPQGAAGTGVRVGDVTRGSGAAKGGLRAGDILVELDGQPTQTPADVALVLAGHLPQESIDATVLRGAERAELTIELSGR